MAISVIMPALEMAQETGKLLAWRKKEGDQVTKGEPLLEVETDKAVVELEAPGDGTLSAITAKAGDEVPVGRTIAWLLKPGEVAPANGAQDKPPSARAMNAAVSPASAVQETGAAHTAAAPQISPKARRLANELGIDIGKIRGTGGDGVITLEDVQLFANIKGDSSPPAKAESEPLSAVARLMAERTANSWTTVPHFFVSRDFDVAALVKFQTARAAEIAQAGGGKLSLTDVLIGLATRVLQKHPRINSSWVQEGAIKPNEDVNICVAIAVKDGVVSAVIHSAHKKTLQEISSKRQELTELARSGKLKPADINGGTFTISNLGMYKVDTFTAIIPPLQAAILGVGAIVNKVVVVDGKPAVRPMLTVTLSSDHRLVDGRRAAEFLADLADAVREPEKWLSL